MLEAWAQALRLKSLQQTSTGKLLLLSFRHFVFFGDSKKLISKRNVRQKDRQVNANTVW